MQKYLTEMIGSFFLVLALGLGGDALSSGLLLAATIYLGGQISGAHYNPAVTLAFWAGGYVRQRTFWVYLAAQMTGALAASFLIYTLSGATYRLVPAATASPFQYASVEILFAFLLCMIYMAFFLTRHLRNSNLYGLVIGLTYAGVLMAGTPVTGGSFNPAVALAVSVTDFLGRGEAYRYLAFYVLAPVTGGIIAGNLFSYLVRHGVWREEA